MPPVAKARVGAWLMPVTNIMPLTRCTMRSPATPVPYSFQQRQRAKVIGSKGFLGAVPSQVSQSKLSGERPGGGGYSHAPVGSLRPRESSTESSSPMAPCIVELLGFGEQGGADALRADLHDASGFFGGGNHGGSVCHSVGHRLLAVNVFAGGDGVDDDLFVPVVGHGDDERLDVMVGEELLILARGHDVGADDFFGEELAAVP